MKNIFVRALFLGVILIGAHDFAHAATLCDMDTNPCTTFYYRDYTTGKIYCRMPDNSNHTCTATSNTGTAVAGYLASPYCENGYGATTPTCFAQDCSQVQSGNFQDRGNSCVKYVCAPGYTGTATNSNNAGCIQCTNKPTTGASYTTNNSCDWECNTSYYKSDNKCVQCPSSSTGGIYMTPQLQGSRPGITDGPGKTSVSDCYIPGDDNINYYDATGKFKIDAGTKCAY